MTVGDRIRICRETKGISQTELANSLKINKQNLYKYENNIITNIPSDKIEAIAKKLDVSPAYLMGWENPNHYSTLTNLTPHETSVITAYRDQPEMQPAVDKLLGVNADEDTVVLPGAARSADNRPVGTIHISKEKLEQLRNAPSVDKEEDI